MNDSTKGDQDGPRLIGIGETLDDRDETEPEFQVMDELSSANTGYGGEDPACESDPRNDVVLYDDEW